MFSKTHHTWLLPPFWKIQPGFHLPANMTNHFFLIALLRAWTHAAHVCDAAVRPKCSALNFSGCVLAEHMSTHGKTKKSLSEADWTKGRRVQMPNVSPHFAHPALENTGAVPLGWGFHGKGTHEVVPRSCRVPWLCVCVSVLRVSVWDYSTGRVGGPLVCCEIKLKDWAEGECGPFLCIAKMSSHDKHTHALRQCITSRIQLSGWDVQIRSLARPS